MKFLLDAQLSRKLAAYLVERGHDAVHVATMPQGFTTPDAEITAFATADYIELHRTLLVIHSTRAD